MDYLTLTLRLIHIVGGIFWVGSALLMNVFIAPTLRATGDSGKQFASHLMTRTRFTNAMTISVYATVIAGFWLYGIDSNWFQSPWMSSGAGVGYGIGAAFGIVGMVAGIKNGANNRKMAELGSKIQGKPTTEQMAVLSAIQEQQAWIVPVNSYTLLVAAFFMAIARYLVF
ncbi:MAG TPA: hypothetical protein DCX53_14080 [Anaerolineae bacterium]|nr:hypothetical protein [Anaerolineae bacterium]